MEVDLGEKTTIRYQSSWGDVTSYAMENVSVNYMAELDYNELKKGTQLFGMHLHLTFHK